VRVKVNKDRIFVILEPMVTTKEVTNKFGEKIGEIELPENHHERSRIGVIQQVGDEVKDFKPGDKVLLSVYAGTRIHLIGRKIDGKEIDEDCFRIIREEEILCLFEDD
jgi:co-chaperonin GroES (HSP10)